MAMVYIVDDDPGMLTFLETVMTLESIPALFFRCAQQFLSDYKPTDAGCLILDLEMPGMSGLGLLEQLQERGILIPVIIMTGGGDIPAVVRSMKLGAIEFLQKPLDRRILVATVREALQADAARRETKATADDFRARLSLLTNREDEVLQLLVEGLSNKQVALRMGISRKTVENHRASIMAKTRAVNVADLVRMRMLAGTA